MTKLAVELQSLSPSAIIELYELDVDMSSPGTSVYYFHAGTNEVNTGIVWNGRTYTPLPLSVTGFDVTIAGQLPRVKVQLSNTSLLFTSLAINFNDLLKSKLTRRRTFARFLDAVNFPLGNAEADPTVELPSDVFYAERKVSENKHIVEMEFASRFDVEGVKLPRRQVLANVCPWAFRGTTCGYTGAPKLTAAGVTISTVATTTTPFPQFNAATTYTVGKCVWYLSTNRIFILHTAAAAGTLPTDTTKWTESGCPKRLQDCRTHFGSGAELPYGGFPGVEKLS